jgi:two-component system, chemotaxis family, sensor kinase CheA
LERYSGGPSLCRHLRTNQNTILIVDDNHQILEATSELPRICGLPAITAQNGKEALDLLKQRDDVSVLLLDLWMSVMDGWEFLRRKKSDPAPSDGRALGSLIIGP